MPRPAGAKNKPKVLQVKFKRLSPSVILPTKKYPSDAGFDLYMPVNLNAAPNTTYKIPLGFATEIPRGYYGHVTSRGSAFTCGLNVVGTVDADYRGEWILFIHNGSNNTVSVMCGDRVAQVIFQVIPVVEVVEVQELAETERGDGALGSTGR
jgi:dUTP pyrophosphatase